MNGIDVVFLLILLGGLALGFFQGTIKLLVAIIAFYVSIVLASLYFQAVGNFFRVRFDRLTPSERNFLRAMAALGPGAQRTGDIANKLGVKVTSLGPVRAKLIKKGMIYSPAHGDMAFTVPLFDEFMIRAIPQFKA